MTGSAHPDRDRALADQLLAERGLPEAAHLTLLAVVAFLLRHALPPSILIGWSGAIVGIIAARVVLWTLARRASIPPGAVALRVRWTMSLLGLTWGTGTAIAAQYVPPETAAALVLGLAGLLAGGLATLVADRWAFGAYALALFVPVLIGLLRSPGSADGPVVAVVVVFVAFMVRLHTRAHRMLVTRLQVEAQLRDRDRQFAAAQAIAHIGSWELDFATNQVTWSDEAYALYGVLPGSPVGYEVFLACVHQDDRARVRALIDQSLAQGLNIEYEYRVARPDGAIRHLLGRNIVTTDGAGKRLRYAGTSLDITERKKTEDALRTALLEVKTLRGYLRACASCRRVLAQDGTWEQLESYVRRHTEAQFSHGICPDCAADWARSAERIAPRRD